MILNCPNCSTRFLIDPSALGSAVRTVQCGACGHRWAQEPERPAVHTFAAPDSDAADAGNGERNGAGDPEDRAEPPPVRRRQRQPHRLFSLLLLAVIVVILLGCYQFRSIIVAYWPDTAPFYEVLGINAKPHPAIRPPTANR